MPDVLLAYAISALLIAIVFVAAFLLRPALGGVRFLNLVGLVIVAIALLEKAGWSTRPWTAGSPAALFNDLLFRIIFLVGIALVFTAQLTAKR